MYLSPSAVNFQALRASMTALSNCFGGSADTMITSVTLPFSSIMTRASTRPFSIPRRMAAGGYTGSTRLIGVMPRRIAGLGGGGGAGGASTTGGAITWGSVGGTTVVGAEMTGSVG